MAVREKKRDVIIDELVSKLYSIVRCMEDGDQATVGGLVSKYLTGRGYEFRWLDGKHDKGWTKDDRKTFYITLDDLFDVMDRLDAALEGEVILDFSQYENMIVGLPFALSFTVRKVLPAESK